jgi:phosphoribosylaminoimidazole (AIR) synthetase
MEQKEIIHFVQYKCGLCDREYETENEARTCASNCTLILSKVKKGDIIMRRKSMLHEFSLVRDIYNGRPVGTSIMFNHQYIDITDTVFNAPSLTGEQISHEKFKEHIERLRAAAHKMRDGLIEEITRVSPEKESAKLMKKTDEGSR